MSTALVVHGHFYQPPRENPWTEIVDREPSAHPFHDWNERIYHECYRANAYARVLDGFGRVEKILDNYRHLSWNFGPTLLSWLEERHPETYRRLLESDRQSAAERDGHGNAIAQGYNHSILPLCNERDRITQVRWGLADFRHRFRRDPESLWLPETACNDAVLGTLIDEGLRYVILSPHQAERVRPLGSADWTDVSAGHVDPGVPYRYFHRDGSGRWITIFFYDAGTARAIAFEGGLATSQALVEQFRRAAGGEERVVHVATDGESYGHHTKFGERSLAHAFEHEAPANHFWVTNYGAFLDRHPAVHEAEIKPGPGGEGTAWSCAHGVGRWYRDCGCSTGAREGWNQAWRGPLRHALDYLRDRGTEVFEREGGALLRDPWAARDEYVELILDRQRSRVEFLERHAARPLGEPERERALALLEMQRSSLLMYTSCGWFFADISGIETVQVLKYAARMLDGFTELDLEPPREHFLEILAEAKSNLPEMGNGADVFRRFADPSRTTPEAIAAHLAMLNLLEERERASGTTAGYRHRRKDLRKRRQGRVTLATGRLTIESVATGRSYDLAFAATHLGGIDFYTVLKPFPGRQQFQTAQERLWEIFPTASLPRLMRVAQEAFGTHEYGLEHVLPEGRERISGVVFGHLVERFTSEYAMLYEDSHRMLEMLQGAGFELPAELRSAAEFTLGRRFESELNRYLKHRDESTYRRAMEIAEEIHRRGYRIDRALSPRAFGKILTRLMWAAIDDPSPENLRPLVPLLDLSSRLGFGANLQKAQEIVYQFGRRSLPTTILPEICRRLGLVPESLENGEPSPPRASEPMEEARTG